MTSLAAVADELYALAPDDFTAARDAAARRARDGGDRDLAGEVKQLRRPSVGAWLVNQLARRHGDQLGDLLDLGATLRAAQDALDGAELRTMTHQRRQVIRSLSQLAAEIAADADRRVGDAAQREVEATLDAALADEQAAHAVGSGRLMRALTSTGLEAVDLTDAVAAPDDVADRPRRATRSSGSAPTPRASAQSAAATKAPAKKAVAPKRDERRAAAERAAAEARDSLIAAERNLAGCEAEFATARDAVTAARERVSELADALAEANEQKSAAEQNRRSADQARKTATRARDAAQRAVDLATKKLRS